MHNPLPLPSLPRTTPNTDIHMLNLNPHAPLPRRPSSNNIPNNIKLATTLLSERKPLLRVGEECLADGERRVRVPVVRTLCAADYCPAVERAWDAEGPGSVGILAG
jgi:hypothetical protein